MATNISSTLRIYSQLLTTTFKGVLSRLITLDRLHIAEGEDHFVADIVEGTAVVADAQKHVHVFRDRENIVH